MDEKLKLFLGALRRLHLAYRRFASSPMQKGINKQYVDVCFENSMLRLSDDAFGRMLDDLVKDVSAKAKRDSLDPLDLVATYRKRSENDVYIIDEENRILDPRFETFETSVAHPLGLRVKHVRQVIELWKQRMPEDVQLQFFFTDELRERMRALHDVYLEKVGELRSGAAARRVKKSLKKELVESTQFVTFGTAMVATNGGDGHPWSVPSVMFGTHAIQHGLSSQNIAV